MYDLVEIGPGSLGICVADVAGRGPDAALHASRLRAAVGALAMGGVDPRAVCETMNRVLCRWLRDEQFTSLFYGNLDLSRRRLVYTNAGHNSPILLRRDGSCVRLSEGGGVLGAFPGWPFDQAQVRLSPGDRLLIFTDGVTETRNADGDEFGEGRLIGSLARHRALDATSLRDALMADVGGFAGGPPEDDLTLVVVASSSSGDDARRRA